MSLIVSRTDGATVITVVSDPKCRWPPLCQILKGFCYSPACCSVPQHLRRVRRVSLSVLGTLHIMIGLFSFSLGIVLHYSNLRGFYFWTHMEVTGFPYWSATLFAFFGAMCIWSEKNPCPCLVIPSLVLNVVGITVAAAAIALYSIYMTGSYGFCGHNYNTYYYWDDCSVMETGIGGVLVLLSVLEFCVAISSVILEANVLKSLSEEENTNTEPYTDVQNLESSREPEQTTNTESTEHSYETYINHN